MLNIKNIAIIGSGNVANYLAVQFYSKQFNILQVISSNSLTGKLLADKVNAEFISTYDLKKDLDLVLICVPDHQIKDCADNLDSTNALVCHCAGSIDMQILAKFKNHGVFYPLQSLASGTITAKMEVPFLIESNTENGLAQLKYCLEKTGHMYIVVSSEKRLYYHLAAVYANNFTNAMLVATEEIVEKYQLDLSILKPLIFQTFEKTVQHSALNTQTGPAKRQDFDTIQKHLELLKDEASLGNLYNTVTEYIAKKFNH